MTGFSTESSQNIASIVQVSTQRLHPIHLLWFSITPPPGLLVRAFVGQTFAHGGSLQALQTTTMNPLSTPPTDLI